MCLTNYGGYVLNNVHKILNLLKDRKRPAAEGQLNARLSIAFQNYNDTLFSIIRDFHYWNPNVEFNIYGSTLNEPFSVSSFDFIVGNSNTKLPLSLNSLTIEPRGYFAVIPRTHVLADAKTIRLNQLRDEPFCFLKDDKGNFEEAYQFCIECGFIPNAILVTNHSYYKNRFLSEGRCCGIIPTGWRIPYSLSQKLVVIPLEGFEHYTDIQLYWSDDALHSVTASRFLEHVKEKLQRQD